MPSPSIPPAYPFTSAGLAMARAADMPAQQTLLGMTDALARLAACETALGIANAVQYATPTTGQTVVSNGSAFLALAPAGLLAALTVTFPASPTNGQPFEIVSSQAITLLTLNGGTIKGLITAIAVNGWARWRYVSTASAWFRAS